MGILLQWRFGFVGKALCTLVKLFNVELG